MSKGRSGQSINPGSQPLPECDNGDNTMAADEKLVLIGKLSKSQRNELDLREKVKEQETRLRNMRYVKSGLHLTITKQEKIISALEREVAALKGAMDLESHRSSRRRSSTTKGKKAVLEDELKAFRSVVFAMEKDLSFNVDQETKELSIVDSEDDNTDKTRCWIGRGDLVNVGAGLVQGPDASHEYMPKCPIELAARHGFYTPSGPFHEILRDIAEAVISRPDLIQLYDENERKTFISKIARSPYMLGRVRRFTNDRVSNRKRLFKERFFELLGYDLISVRNIERMSPSEKQNRDEQIKELQEKLLGKDDTSLWRMAPFKDLKYSASELPSDESQFSSDTLFQNVIGPQLLRSFFGFDPNHCPGTLDSTILYLARLDAWIYTSIKLLNHRAKKGGDTQKIFQDTFAVFLKKAVLSIIQQIREVVSFSTQEELDKKETETGTSENAAIESTWRESTIVRVMPGKEQFYLCVNPVWFKDHISRRLGNVRDAYIGWCGLDGSFFNEFVHGEMPIPKKSTMSEDRVAIPNSPNDSIGNIGNDC